jgi:hypothetical protein
MNAAGIIQALIALGLTVKDAVTKNTTAGKIDWVAAVKAVIADPATNASVTKLLADLNGANFGAAIAEIEGKQTALLNGRTLSALSNAEMLQYDDLADARLALATSELKAALDANVAEWLVNNVLPVLTSAAPSILALLL